MDSDQRTYICIDLKSYYASVECVERGLDPLTTNLVVADETRTDMTICLAVSPSLKAYGIPGRGRLHDVKTRLEEIKRDTGEDVHFIIAMPRMQKYLDTSAQIYGIFLKYVAPEDIHVYSIDESFIDVTSYLSLYQMTAHELAVQMIRDVLDTVGITATVGIGSNMYLAKVAMDIVAKKVPADTDGVRIAELDKISFREKLWEHQPLTDFWGIGGGISSHLAEMGIYTMGDLALLSSQNQEVFFREFGVDGEILIDHAWGEEPTQIENIKRYHPATKSISSGQVLKRAYSYDEARLVIREMTEDVTEELLERGMLAQGITLYVGYDRLDEEGLSHYSGPLHDDCYGRKVPASAKGTAKLGAPTVSPSRIMDTMMQLFDEKVNPKLNAKRLGVSVIRLTTEADAPPQLDLFTDYKAEQREIRLARAQMALHKRFGDNCVFKAMDLKEGATTIERNGQIGGHRA